MTIDNRINGSTVTLLLSGRLDAAKAPLLEQKIKQWGNNITEIILDFTELTYISSMGLRVLLHAKKMLRKDNRKLTIKNMTESIKEVFQMTGFLNLMVQEEQFVLLRKDEADNVVLSFIGRMKSDHIAAVSKELYEIKKAGLFGGEPFTVIMDMQNLVFISPRTCKLLKETIDATVWEKMAVSIRNVPPNIAYDMENEGMGDLIKKNEK